ncbi:class I adenylate-forming enzyme family protein [Arthrobacter sp. ISL-5]|uniref:class I adenylate-forming enzyme family protein n=1 Tax=Arthrobacter sp. ISL-5 TaxID=2819111 RepID=UPI001BE670CF|nr:class I adenylate-forming enzyme family protein [Arthrobacter sp. ISL-5]MBT2554173.1 acyl--CoA ligase [Arthrobacter sp. ISL-5]
MSERKEKTKEFVDELAKVATVSPKALAIIDGPLRVTYEELMNQVNELAVALQQAGLRSGDRVALVAENSAEYLVTAFAVWRAHAVLVTIYPSSTVSTLGHCLNSSDPVLVFVNESSFDSVRQAVPDWPVALISDPSVPPVRKAAKETPADVRDSLALICYTSGTTSYPKAVMVSTKTLYHGASAYSESWHLGPSDRTVVSLPMAWLYGLNTTSMATLLRGGTVIPLRRSRPSMLIDAIVEHKATFLPGVTTMFAKLVQHLDGLDSRPDLSSLRFCLSAGEPRNEHAFDRWTAYTGVPVFDNYSASECYPLVTYDPQADPAPVPGSAGKVVPGSELRVVDRNGNDVEPGEVGEGLSRSPGLMLGYWEDAEQTRAAMTNDGWYRTKDLVRVDESGFVYVVGRLSDMIIRGGSNVSPAEVERVVREHPGVRDVSVVGLPDDTYGQRVVAAVVPDSSVTFDSTSIAEFCSKHLPSYMVPNDYIPVQELPQSKTTGKVDRRQVTAILEANRTTATSS